MRDSNNNEPGSVNSSRNTKIENMEVWQNEHGQPSFDFLKTLLASDEVQAIEKLRSIADDLDVEYEPGTSKEELVDRIMSAANESSNATT